MPQDISGAYDRWSATYDSDPNPTRDLDLRVVREHAPPPAGRDVVEVGCGTGKNTAWLAHEARRVTALDFSAGMLTRARARIGDAPHVAFVRHDVTQPWPVADAAADLVIGNLVLEHVDDLGPVLREAARVLRPGGHAFLCELHPMRQLLGGQAHFVAADSGETVHVPAYVHTVSEYVNAGLDAGLQVERLGEWLEDGARQGAPPRLFSVTFRKPA